MRKAVDRSSNSPVRKSGGQKGGFVLGMIVGLLIGLAVALGVALYITKVPVPFMNKVPQRTAEQDAAETERNKNWDPNAPLAGKNASKAASGVIGGNRPVVAPDAAPAPAIPVPPAAANTAPPVAAASTPSPRAERASPSAAAASALLAGGDPFTYFVQAGAFGKADDAEQQRAKLAMLGFSAKVFEREQAGRTVYRVRLGPFEKKDEADAQQQKIEGAGLEAQLVRVQR